MKKALLFTSLVIMTSTYASRLSPLTNLAYDVADSIAYEEDYLNSVQRREIRGKLKEIKMIINGMTFGTGQATYSAKCGIDNDREFTYNQGSGGTIEGTLDQIMRECKVRAEASFGRNSSSGLSKVRVLTAPAHYTTAIECWIDDDPSFTMGQIRIGVLKGTSTQDVLNSCKKIAKDSYGSKGSAGLKF